MFNLAKALLPWLGIFAAVILAIVVVPEAIEGIRVSHEVENYRSTRAVVTSHYERKQKKGPSTYVVDFQYHVNDKNLRGTNHFTQWTDNEDDVEKLIRKEESGKETILVFYDPQQPRRVVIHKDVPVWPHFIWIGLTVVVFVLSVTFAIAEVRQKRYLKASRIRLEAVGKKKEELSRPD